MIGSNNISILTGMAGCGKSFTATRCITPGTGIFTPSHVSKRVAQKYVLSSGKKGVSVEVTQYLPYMLFKNPKYTEQTCTTSRGERFLSEIGIQCASTGADGIYSLSNHRRQFQTVLFDEVSMMSLYDVSSTLTWVVKHFPNCNRAIFCGDPNQLKSIHRGNVLNDLIQSRTIAHVHLTKNMRSKNALAENLHAVLDGRDDILQYDTTFSKVRIQPSELEGFKDKYSSVQIPIQQIVTMFKIDKELKQEPHIIVYKNKVQEEINKAIEAALLPPRRKGVFLRPRMKVQALTNDYAHDGLHKRGLYIVVNQTEMANETGPTDDTQTVANKRSKIRLKNWDTTGAGCHDEIVEVVVPTIDIQNIFSVAYATTGHSSQGCQMGHVYCIGIADNCKFLDSDALYTFISRAQQKCVIFSTDSDIHKIVTRKNPPRKSNLHRLLNQNIRQPHKRKLTDDSENITTKRTCCTSE